MLKSNGDGDDVGDGDADDGDGDDVGDGDGDDGVQLLGKNKNTI